MNEDMVGEREKIGLERAKRGGGRRMREAHKASNSPEGSAHAGAGVNTWRERSEATQRGEGQRCGNAIGVAVGCGGDCNAIDLEAGLRGGIRSCVGCVV